MISMPGLNLKVQAISLSQRIYQALVAAILDGHFKPGDWLRESFLCEELGVSSTPLREALQQLVHEGLAERIPNVGVRVAVLDTEDVIEIYDLREYLERLAICLSIKRRTVEDLIQLEELQRQGYAALQKNDLIAYREYNKKLHNLFLTIAGSRRLRVVTSSLQLQIEVVMARTILFPGRPMRAIKEHGDIIQALREQDAELAERLIYEHIRQAKEELILRLCSKE